MRFGSSVGFAISGHLCFSGFIVPLFEVLTSDLIELLCRAPFTQMLSC